ncbi:DUF1266 domain-containing protein [Streptomyces sp. SGAir0957]
MTFGPPPQDFGPAAAAAPAWNAPTPTEQALYEAKSRGDWAAYYETLARAYLYFVIDRAHADTHADSILPLYCPPHAPTYRWEVFTDGMLPTPEPNLVFTRHPLHWFARSWTPTDPPLLTVNPGSPCEVSLPAGPPHATHWARVADHVGSPRLRGHLRALSVGGPLHGTVAHGLACGALLCVTNGSLWNAMGWHGTGYDKERERLREWWGITTREEWRSALDGLLACESHSPVWEFALSLRRTIARDFGGHVDPAYWRQAAETVMRRNAAERTTLSEDGVTYTEPRPEAETTARIEGVQRLIGRITRYESRMRADGVLAEGRYVSSVDAWDLGRASKMARWGLGARFGTLQEAESAVVAAGRAASLSYRSWQDFSAGYILGRCLHFDDEEFGDWYEDMVQAHRILTEDPGSPWLNIPFQ